MVQMVGSMVSKGTNQRAQNRRNEGAGMTAAGTVVGGAGLVAGGIPGRKEPDGLEVFNIRGTTKKKRPLKAKMQEFVPAAERDPRVLQSPLHPSNLRHNAKKVAPLPRAGVLGFRASIHDGFIKEKTNEVKTGIDTKTKQPLTTADKARLQGKLDAEAGVVRGMRRARKLSYGATIGGTALAAAGVKRSRDAGVAKREKFEEASAAAAAGGATLATVGVAGQKVSSKFERKYANQAKANVLRAQKIVPKAGGLETLPEKTNEFGVAKPAKQTMYPARTDGDIKRTGVADKISPVEHKKEFNALRGKAAQERHFAEVFSNVRRGFKRTTGPAAAVGLAGAAGLAGTRGRSELEELRRERAARQSVGKRDRVLEEELRRQGRVGRRNDQVQTGLGLLGVGAGLGLTRGRKKGERLAASLPGTFTAAEGALNLQQGDYPDRLIRKALKVNGVRMKPTDVGAMWFADANPDDLEKAKRLAAKLKTSAGTPRSMGDYDVRRAAQENLVRPTPKQKRESTALRDADRRYKQMFGKSVAGAVDDAVAAGAKAKSTWSTGAKVGAGAGALLAVPSVYAMAKPRQQRPAGFGKSDLSRAASARRAHDGRSLPTWRS